MPYVSLGAARYVRHESEKPMRIVWELERASPRTPLGNARVPSETSGSTFTSLAPQAFE